MEHTSIAYCGVDCSVCPDYNEDKCPDQAATIHIAEKHGFAFVGYEDSLAIYRLSL